MAFRPFENAQVSLLNLQDEFNQMVNRIWHQGVSTGPFDGQEWGPPVDLFEHHDHYRIFVEIPGVDPACIDVSHLKKTLMIRGEKKTAATAPDGCVAIKQERRFGTFCRSIEIPDDIKVEELTASYQAGVLEVTVPKVESSKPMPIKINIQQSAD